MYRKCNYTIFIQKGQIKAGEGVPEGISSQRSVTSKVVFFVWVRTVLENFKIYLDETERFLPEYFQYWK